MVRFPALIDSAIWQCRPILLQYHYDRAGKPSKQKWNQTSTAQVYHDGRCYLTLSGNMKKLVPVLMAVAALLTLTITACRDSQVEGDVRWHDRTAGYHRSASAGPYQLHYLDIGQGEPVLMIHGWADSAYTWHKNLPKLTQPGFRLVLIDLPGMGQSTIPPQPYSYTVENMSRAVLHLADHLHLQRFTIAGHSMGGSIALYVCLYHPRRVNRAVTIAPACYPPSHRTGRFLLNIPGVKPLAGALAGRWTVAFALKETFYNEDLVTAEMVSEYARPFSKPAYADAVTSLALDFFSPAHTQMMQSYNRLETPLLIIWGANDKWLPPAMGRRLHGQVSGSRLIIIPQAGHNVHQEAHTRVNRHIIQFLALTAKESGAGIISDSPIPRWP
jgi:pimeloyl-ACP methyl ester carboxylesterase